MLLVPATMELLGAKNWWMPRWLDRLAPRLSAEGPGTAADADADRHDAAPWRGKAEAAGPVPAATPAPKPRPVDAGGGGDAQRVVSSGSKV